MRLIYHKESRELKLPRTGFSVYPHRGSNVAPPPDVPIRGSRYLRGKTGRRLSDDEQRIEIEGSRHRLADELGRPPRTIAYPVGSPTHVNEATVALCREAGYEAGFLFDGNLNGWPPQNPFLIARRESADDPRVDYCGCCWPKLFGYGIR